MRFPIAVVALAWTAVAALAQDPEPQGFFPSSVAGQKEAEEVFLATPAPAKVRRWLAQLTEEPHVAGTEQEKVVAEYSMWTPPPTPT